MASQEPAEYDMQLQALESSVKDQPCNRCGDPAETILNSMPVHGGVPICYRCLTEIQLDHALERAAKIPELEAKLESLGGRAKVIVCGYIFYTTTGDPTKLGSFCWRAKGHGEFHDSEKLTAALTDIGR